MYACLYRPPQNTADHEPDHPDALVAIAKEFSPRYESERDGSVLHAVNAPNAPDPPTRPNPLTAVTAVTIDIRGLDRLLGDARTIGEELRREAASRGVRVHVAVAATRTAALLLAIANPGLTVVAPGGQWAALAPLAIGILQKLDNVSARAEASEPPAALATFSRWGLKTLGEVAALPPADLSSRLGKPGVRWQALARGEDLRPLVPDAAEERFESSMDLEWPIEGLEPLSFVLTRLLEPLSIRLERRDRGVAVLHVQLGLVGGDLHARSLQLPSPMRDVRALRTLALLDLESHPPSAAIDRVTIVIDPTPGRVVQHTLFARPQPTPEQLSTLLARLGAVMGQDRIGAPATVDSYRPGAFAMKPFAVEARAPSLESQASRPEPRVPSPEPRAPALRRCRYPVPARVAADAQCRPVRVTTDRRGFAGGAVVCASGPWRTSGEWWTTAADKVDRAGGAVQPGWDRDEWDVTLNDGGSYRVFMDRATGSWFIDAICD
jgi:protein ImuB